MSLLKQKLPLKSYANRLSGDFPLTYGKNCIETKARNNC